MDLHVGCDALSNPIRFFVTAGKRSAYIKALDLIEGQAMSALIADKGYDANYIVDAAKCVQAEAVIPPDLREKLHEIMISNCIRNGI